MLRKLRPDHKFIKDCSDEKDQDLSTRPNQRGEELLQRMVSFGRNYSGEHQCTLITVEDSSFIFFLTLHGKSYLGNVHTVLLPANRDQQIFHSAKYSCMPILKLEKN